jgi:hypothetical protein
MQRKNSLKRQEDNREQGEPHAEPNDFSRERQEVLLI